MVMQHAEGGNAKPEESNQAKDSEGNNQGKRPIMVTAARDGKVNIRRESAQDGLLQQVQIRRVDDKALAKPEILGHFGPQDLPYQQPPFRGALGIVFGSR